MDQPKLTTVILSDRMGVEREIELENPGKNITVEGQKYYQTQQYNYGKPIYKAFS